MHSPIREVIFGGETMQFWDLRAPWLKPLSKEQKTVSVVRGVNPPFSWLTIFVLLSIAGSSLIFLFPHRRNKIIKLTLYRTHFIDGYHYSYFSGSTGYSRIPIILFSDASNVQWSNRTFFLSRHFTFFFSSCGNWN
ncbi:hypothetical protein AHAS_Ahas19G0151000 [Arachis hypogaea]